MSLPSLPNWIPAERYAAVELRSIETDPKLESETFVFLTDTQEWAVTTDEDAAVVLSVFPSAKIIVRE